MWIPLFVKPHVLIRVLTSLAFTTSYLTLWQQHCNVQDKKGHSGIL